MTSRFADDSTGMAKPFRVIALFLIALPLLLTLVAISSGSASSTVIPFAGFLLLMAVVFMAVADRLNNSSLPDASVVFPLLTGCVIVLLGFVFREILGIQARRASSTPLSPVPIGMIVLAVMLMSSNLNRMQRKRKKSFSLVDALQSPETRLKQLEAKIETLEGDLIRKRSHADELKREVSSVRTRILSVEENLQLEKNEVARLHGEVDELRLKSVRLEELDAWIWPASEHESSAASSFWRGVEQGCKDPGVRRIGQSLLGRLHLIAIFDESEPDRFADLLDLAGRDLHDWLDFVGRETESTATLESDFLAISKEYAGRFGLEIRPVRPGDTVDQNIHDPVGSGLQVVKPRSFYIRRITDRSVLRRAQVDV